MNQNTDYKHIPTDLLGVAAERNPMANLDPMLCGYQILFDKFNIPKTGVVHLGGHIGQELPMYAALGFQNVVMVEPLEEEYQILEDRISKYNQVFENVGNFLGEKSLMKAHAVRCAVSDTTGTISFYKTGVTSLSSMSKPIAQGFSTMWDSFGAYMPWYQRLIYRVKRRRAVSYQEVVVPCKTLDQVIAELPHSWKANDFSYLRMNVQGAELKALKGADKFLQSVSVVDLETNIESRYEDNPTRQEFDSFLDTYGFVAAFSYSLGPMGNIIYVKK